MRPFLLAVLFCLLYAGTPVSAASSGAGIGVKLVKIGSDPISIKVLIPGRPASNAGLKVNDKIIKVDDQETTDWKVPELVSHLNGAAGTYVKLTVIRPGTAIPLSFSVQRSFAHSVD